MTFRRHLMQVVLLVVFVLLLGGAATGAAGAEGKISFHSERDAGDDEIYVMNADGTNLTNLADNSGADFDHSWSPDGSEIAFTSSRDAPNNEIYVMNSAYGSRPAIEIPDRPS